MFRGSGSRNDEAMNGVRDSLDRYNVTSDFRFNDSTWRSQSPKPNAEKGGNDQRDPAQAHRDRERSDGDVGLID